MVSSPLGAVSRCVAQNLGRVLRSGFGDGIGVMANRSRAECNAHHIAVQLNVFELAIRQHGITRGQCHQADAGWCCGIPLRFWARVNGNGARLGMREALGADVSDCVSRLVVRAVYAAVARSLDSETKEAFLVTW